MNCKEVEVAVDLSVRKRCTRRYPGHPRGCPNYGKHPRCPPRAPLITDEINPHFPVFVIWNRFDFGAHVERMRERHPEWSERQLANCLYWQGTARKQLRKGLEEFNSKYPGYTVATTPEAMGVNVTETMKRAGVELEWPPVRYAYQVAVAYLKADDDRKADGDPA